MASVARPSGTLRRSADLLSYSLDLNPNEQLFTDL